jgi:hypothetical protein
MPCVNGDTRVSLTLGVVEVRLVAGDVDVVLGELMEVGLRLLQADEIRVLLAQPLEQTFGRRGTDAAAVDGDDAHGGAF